MFRLPRAPQSFSRVTAGNILYGLTAGTGMSVSTGQTPTVTNTGVLSLGGSTGALSLTAGGGMTVDGLKVTNSDRGTSQNIFKTIAVSGQTSVAAGSNTDTLTVVQSGGITLTTDATGKTLTINADTPDYTLSGWTDGGTSVGLTTLTDAVVVDGITFGGATITNGHNLLPDTDLGSDLGSAGKRFNNLWVANINSNSSQAFSGQTTFSYAPTDTTLSQASVIINPTTSTANGQLLAFAIAGYQKALMDEDGDIVLGYSDAVNAPVTDTPLTIYGHNGTIVASVDTTGNLTLVDTAVLTTKNISNILSLDTTNSRVGIGTTAPATTLTVVGDMAAKVASGVEGLKLTDTSDATKLAMKWTGSGATLDVPGAASVNKLTNGTFDTDITTGGWNTNTLLDQFTTARAAGSVNGTPAEPTGGVRTVVDTNSKLSISGGVAVFATGGVGLGDPGLWYPVTTRAAGKIAIFDYKELVSAFKDVKIGFTTAQSNTLQSGFYLRGNSSVIQTANATPLGTYTFNVTYKLAVILKSSGTYFVIKGGTEYPNWTLLYTDFIGNTSNLYAGVTGNYDLNIDNIRIPTSTWLPTPLAYDTFTTAGATATETTGPDSQTTPQLTWTGGTKAGGVMTITPTLGSDVIINGTFDTDTSWAKGTGWTISGGVASNNGNAGLLTQSVGTINNWYQAGFDLVLEVGQFIWTYAGANTIARNTPGSYTNTLRASQTSIGVYSNSWNGTIDNISYRPLTLSSLFSTVPTSDADVIADVNVTMTAGTQAGLVTNLDSTSSPANFLIAYHDGTNVKLDKNVGGTYTSLINTAATYSAGATLRVITYHSDANTLKVRVYYNNALVGTEQTVTDAGIINNTLHGLFSTYSGNTFDNFTLFARGTGGEYTTGLPDVDLTATRDTTIPYAGTASLKLVAGTNDNAYTQRVTLPDTSSYNLTAYAYTTGAAVTSADVELFSDVSATALTTTYTSAGNGWYKLSSTLTGVTSAKNYGVRVKAGKTVYVDNLALFSSSGAGTTLAITNSTTGLGGLSVESTSTLNSGLASLPALVVKGFSGQSANLQEWQSSSGTVLGAVDALGGLTFSRSTNTTTAYQFNNAAGTAVLDIDTTNGRVGIGSTAPSEVLDVTGNIKASGTLTSTAGTLTLGTTNSLSGTTNLTMQTNNALLFTTNGSTEQMRITASGLVGIGTTAPTSKLQVTGTIAAEAGAGAAALKILSGNNTLALGYGAGSTGFIDVQSVSSANKFTNYTFESNLTGWDYGNALEDQFTTDRAAGAVNGTQAEPTGGIRTVVDTNSKLSITGGQLSFATGGTTGNPTITYPSVTRAAGKMLIFPTFSNGSPANYYVAGWNATNGYQSYIIDNKLKGWSGGFPQISFYDGQSGTVVIILRSTGAYLFFKPTSGNWTFIWKSDIGTNASLTPSIFTNNLASSFDYIKIPTSTWLPTPLAYDTFTRGDGAIGSSETTGPDSQTTPSLAWTGGAISGNKVVITPTTGAEILTDPGLEGNYTSGLNDNLTKIGSPTVSQSADVHGGSKAQAFTGVAQWNGLRFPAFSPTAGWWQGYVWAKRTSGSGGTVSADVTELTVGTTTLGYITASSYTQYLKTGRTAGNSTNFYPAQERGTSNFDAVIVDDASFKQLTLSSLFSTVPTSDTDVVADANVTLTAGTQAGLVTNLDSTSSPANFLIAYHDGTNVKLDKNVGGTYTSLINTAATYSAGATLRVITSTSGGALKVRVYYNNVLIGTEQTVSDAGIISNTKHGLFSTYSGNTFDNFTLFARGTGGEYTDIPDTNLTVTRDTTTTYGNSAGSTKIVAVSGGAFSQSVNVGDTNTYGLTAVIYTDGSAVTSADAQMYAGASPLPTTYTAVGGGWYRAKAAVTGVATARAYGVYVHAGKTVYLDDFALIPDSSTTSLAIQNTLTGLGQLAVESTTTLNSGLASLQGLIVKGSLSQTANLQEWQGSTGAVLGSLTSTGSAYFAGNVGIGTAVSATKPIDTGTGAYLSNVGVWENTSSIALKENFTPVDPADLLTKIARLPLTRWNYKANPDTVTHIGPTAEKFYEIFGVGEDATHLAALDTAGIALAGVQALIDKGNTIPVLTSLNQLEATGAVTFRADAEFIGSAVFRALTEYFSAVTYDKNVTIEGTPSFNKDSVGQAKMATATSQVDVTFAVPYDTPPVVTFSPIDSDGHKAYLTNVSEKGFRIVIPDVAMQEYLYNWNAVAVADMKTTKSISPFGGTP